MAGNTRIPKAELNGIYGAIVKRMSRKMLGDVAEPVEVAWHNRKVVNFSFAVGRRAQGWDRCDENLKSFAHLAVASLSRGQLLPGPRYFQAHNEGLDLAKACEVPRVRRLHAAGARRDGVRRGDVADPAHGDRRALGRAARPARRARRCDTRAPT